jgi:hypothetical protein
MGYIDVSNISLTLPDGRPLLDDVSFRVGEGTVSADDPVWDEKRVSRAR